MFIRKKCSQYLSDCKNAFFQYSSFSVKNIVSKASSLISDQINIKNIHLVPFIMLCLLKKVKGEDVYVLDNSSDIEYKLNYTSPQLSDMEMNLAKCNNILIHNVTQLLYVAIDTVQCEEDNVVQSIVDISVEAGKNMTSSFVDCFNKVMLDMCKDDTSDLSMSKQSMIIIGAIVGSIIGLSLLTRAVCGKSCNEPLIPQQRNREGNNSLFFAAATLPLINESTHSDHHTITWDHHSIS